MDLIFKGDRAVAINPDQVLVQRVSTLYCGEKQSTYKVVAFSIDKKDWISLSDEYKHLEDAIKEFDRIYQEAIDLAFNYKKAQEIGPVKVLVFDKRSGNLDLVKSKEPIKVEVISNEIRDLEEEK